MGQFEELKWNSGAGSWGGGRSEVGLELERLVKLVGHTAKENQDSNGSLLLFGR